jgi:hypothetical protein
VEEEFDELYKQLRGSRCASMVLDARVLFLDGDLLGAAKLLDSAEQTFKELRWSTLNQSDTVVVPDPKQRAALDKDARLQIRRKEKTFETLEQMNALQSSLQKHIARQQRKSPASPPPVETTATSTVNNAPTFHQPPAQPAVTTASPSSSPSRAETVANPASTAPQETLPTSAVAVAAPPATRSQQSVSPAIAQSPPRTSPGTKLPQALISKLNQEKGTPERLLILGDFFNFGFIDENHTISVGAYYFVEVSSEHNFFVVAGDPPVLDDAVNLFLAIEGTRIKPFALTKFRTYGRDGKITWLKLKNSKTASPSADAPTDSSSESSFTEPSSTPAKSPDSQYADFVDSKPLPSHSQSAELTDETPGGLDIAERDTILDSGAFSQLVEAAQRTGIVPGVSTIIQLRDCEFRLGRYQQALQTMEGLFGAFTGAAQQRAQRLAREEAELASGKLKISPKDLQAKRIRDNAINDAIDRARGRFLRVLDGLRMVIHRVNELQGQQSQPE